jgi:hypothetical protein
MRYYAIFYTCKNGSYIHPLGDRSLIIIDGRLSEDNALNVARETANNRGFYAFSLQQGDSLRYINMDNNPLVNLYPAWVNPIIGLSESLMLGITPNDEKDRMMKAITKAQRKAIKRKFDQNPDGATSYRQFRKRAVHGFIDCLMLEWCGMWLGIESDGYTHSWMTD